MKNTNNAITVKGGDMEAVIKSMDTDFKKQLQAWMTGEKNNKERNTALIEKLKEWMLGNDLEQLTAGAYLAQKRDKNEEENHNYDAYRNRVNDASKALTDSEKMSQRVMIRSSQNGAKKEAIKKDLPTPKPVSNSTTAGIDNDNEETPVNVATLPHDMQYQVAWDFSKVATLEEIDKILKLYSAIRKEKFKQTLKAS